jgi:hypothetical protein
MPVVLTSADATRGLVDGAQTCESAAVRVALACWLAAFGLLLAACGGGSKPKDNGVSAMTPKQILTTVQEAVKNAKSVHIAGGRSSGGSSFVLNLTLEQGTGATGSITYNGATIQIVKDGDKLYFKAGQVALKQFAGTAVASLVAGRWFVVPTTMVGFDSFVPLTDISKVTDLVLGAAPGTLTVGKETTINGQSAVAVTDTTGGGTLFVATTGPAYPLQLRPKTGSVGLVNFTNWDQPVTITPPSNAIDLEKLIGK